MNEPLGIALELAEKRKALAARMSPQARVVAFPDEHRLKMELQLQLRLAKERCAALEDRIKMLRDDNKELRDRLRNSTRERVTVRQVCSSYCETLAMLGVTIDGQPWTLELIKSRRQTLPYVQVRHVLMNLCRLLTRQSFPSIAQNLGNRDHTTVQHAVRRAPGILEKNPLLRQAHRIVFEKYKANGVTSDTAPAGGEVDGCPRQFSHPSPANIKAAA